MSSERTKPECNIKNCSNTGKRAELWKSGEWYAYCDKHDSIGLGTREVEEVARIS